MSILGGPGFPSLGTISSAADLWHNADIFPSQAQDTAANPITPGIWAEFKIITTLDRNPSIYMMGVTSTLSTLNSAAFVKLASDTVIMTVEWEASCFGNIPSIPDPTEVDDRFILLHDMLGGPAPTVADDGITPQYRLAGVYWYGVIKPSLLTYQDYVIPRYPWLQDVFLRAIPTTALTGGIIQSITATIPIGGIGIPAPPTSPVPIPPIFTGQP